MRAQIKGYSRTYDDTKATLTQEKEKVASLAGMREDVNRLTAERNNLDAKVGVVS